MEFFKGWQYYEALIGSDSMIPVTVKSDMPQDGNIYTPTYVSGAVLRHLSLNVGRYVGLQLQYFQRTATTRRLILASVNLTGWVQVPQYVLDEAVLGNLSTGYTPTYTLEITWAPMSKL